MARNASRSSVARHPQEHADRRKLGDALCSAFPFDDLAGVRAVAAQIADEGRQDAVSIGMPEKSDQIGFLKIAWRQIGRQSTRIA